MIVLALVVFIVVGYLSKQLINNEYESAVEHSIKHLDSKYQCPMHPDIVKNSQGSCPVCGMQLELIDQQEVNKSEEKKLLYWVAPMDANYRRDKPGKSPMGMDLIPIYEDKDTEVFEQGVVVKISPAVENNMGVRITEVKAGPLSRIIETVGYVGLDESRVSHIHLRVDGWIENLSIKIEGDRVKKGQHLFDLYSPKLVNSMEEYMQALNSKNKRLISASREKLSSLGVSKKQIKSLKNKHKVPRIINIYAPQDGIVSMLNVREGMYVKPANRVMTLANLSSVWVLAEVFESQSSWLEFGQPADVALSFVPGRIWSGKVDYIYPSLDAKNRTLRVRLQFDNNDEVLKPNMYANVMIKGSTKRKVLSVPREAVIRSGKNQRVIVAKGNGKFEQREIVAGMESGDRIEINSGVTEGENIVISAQFLIDSEASMKASILRMSSRAVEN